MSNGNPSYIDMDRVQIELLRRAGPRRRAALGLALTTTAIALSRRAIQRLHPDWSEMDVNLFWVEIHYGRALADKVRQYLAAREQA